MITPKVCGDTDFPLINFTIKKILDLGLHLKLTVTDKLFIFDRNHSLHCWKTNDTKIKTTGVSSKQSFKYDKLIHSWQFKKEWHIQETCFTSKRLKEAVSVQMQMDSFTFHTNVQVKGSNPKTVYKCSHLNT